MHELNIRNGALRVYFHAKFKYDRSHVQFKFSIKLEIDDMYCNKSKFKIMQKDHAKNQVIMLQIGTLF